MILYVSPFWDKVWTKLISLLEKSWDSICLSGLLFEISLFFDLSLSLYTIGSKLIFNLGEILMVEGLMGWFSCSSILFRRDACNFRKFVFGLNWLNYKYDYLHYFKICTYWQFLYYVTDLWDSSLTRSIFTL